jgi:hypothetical protein
MACPYPSANADLKMTEEFAATSASAAISDGHCIAIAASIDEFLPLLPPAAEAPFWHSVVIW